VGLLRALWRRYFAEVSVAVVAAGTLAVGLATFTPMLLARCDIHEVSVSCGYALTMLALAAMWKALHEPERRGWWLAAASLAYGLALGARPSLLFGAAILLVPVAQARREPRKLSGERRRIWTLLVAAMGPILLIGLGLMLYNFLRFDNPLEFGWRYQLSGDRQDPAHQFSLRYLWFHFRVYFLEPAQWSGRFPFAHNIRIPPVPAGHGAMEEPFGILTNIPLVWLALAVPLAWRGRAADARSTLCRFLAVAAVLFGTGALTMSLFFVACTRYEVEFLAPLVLLAVIGILSVERALAPTSELGQAGRPVWRHAVRWGWGLLLVFSVAFNLLVSVEHCAEAHYNLGGVLHLLGKEPEAMAHYEQALRLNPDYPEAHFNLGSVLEDQGKVPEAMAHYEQALRLNPDYADVHNNLGVALAQLGRMQEAVGHWEQALRLKPDLAEAHCNLANALAQSGRIQEAIGHYEQALQLNPDYVEAHNNLGIALAGLGKLAEAAGQFEQALRLKPDQAETHNNLAVVLLDAGRIQEGIAHCEQALRLKPDYPEAHYNLAVLLAKAGKVDEAIAHLQAAVQLEPGRDKFRRKLEELQHAKTLGSLGNIQDANREFGQALRTAPDFVDAKTNLANARATQEREVPSRR
jgi:tetratricopeptide (TPR) repeat protein